jgi:hypothetical protein
MWKNGEILKEDEAVSELEKNSLRNRLRLERCTILKFKKGVAGVKV